MQQNMGVALDPSHRRAPPFPGQGMSASARLGDAFGVASEQEALWRLGSVVSDGGSVDITIELTGAPRRGPIWSSLDAGRSTGLTRSGILGLLDDFLPSTLYRSTLAWCVSSVPSFHRVGDEVARQILADIGIAGGIRVAQKLPSGRVGILHLLLGARAIGPIEPAVLHAFTAAASRALLTLDLRHGGAAPEREPGRGLSALLKRVGLSEAFEREVAHGQRADLEDEMTVLELVT